MSQATLYLVHYDTPPLLSSLIILNQTKPKLYFVTGAFYSVERLSSDELARRDNRTIKDNAIGTITIF
ncbi:MAG: hypothetical protein Q4A64_06255 [Porphyromonadaceae bacterium]|nr:hypothetical protein [Porphyromonadaceae bacterium]